MTTGAADLRITTLPVATAAMVIRRPVAEVFEAFIDPAITTQFWFTEGSGRLEPGAQVRWDWEMYGVGADVSVKAIEPNRRILLEWSSGARTTVEWQFTPVGDTATYVTITNAGFHGDGDAVVRQALDSAGGFSYLLAGAKAYLEHGINLNLVADHVPQGAESK